MDLKQELTWVQKHERILFGILFALVLVFGVYKVESILANRASQQVQLLEQKLEDQKELNAALQSQVIQETKRYQDMVDALTKQNAALAAAVTQRNQNLNNQQNINNSIPLSALGERWAALAKLESNEISVVGNTSVLTDSGSRKTVNMLESVPVLEANLKDTEKIADNLKQEVTQADNVIKSQDQQIQGLKAQITDADRLCKAQVTEVKSKARVSKFKWFIGGVASGAIIAAKLLL